MAGNVKGITIEFRGETTKLDSALKKIKGESKGIDAELKQINKSLKFNPKNTTLLAQKQTLLKQKIDQTNSQLKELKAAQADMNAKGVDKNSEQYRKLEREIIEAESKVKHFTSELQRTAAQASKIGQLGDRFKEVGGKATALGNSLRGLSIAAAGVVAGLGAITYKAARNADDINTLSKQYSVSTKDLQMWSAAADLVDVEVTDITKANVRMKRGMNSAMKGTGDAAEAFKKLGVNVKDGNGHMRNSNDVFNETIKKLGNMTNETERDALALQIFGKSAANLNPLIEDAGETYSMVADIFNSNNLEILSQEELDKANEFNDQIDIIKMVFLQAVNVIGSRLAGFLLPAVTKVQEAFTKIAGKIAGLSPAFFTIVGGIAAVVSAVAPALLIFGHLATAIGNSLSQLALMIQKIPMLGKAIGFLSANPIILIIAALVALGLIINKTGLSADELSAKITGFVEKFVAMIPTFIQTIVKMTNTIIQALVTAMPAVIQGLVTLINAIVSALPTFIPLLVNGVTQLIVALSKQLPTLIPIVLNAAVQLFMALVKALPIVLKSLMQALPLVWRAILTSIANFGRQVWNSIKNIVTGVLNRMGFSGLVSKVKGVFNSVKNAITNPITSAKNALDKVISKIKGLFPLKIGKILSEIKIPKIKLDGGKAPWGIAGKGKLPKFSVEWHAQGGIFTRPTLLPDNNGNLHGVGEAGAEAIIPLDKLWQKMDSLANNAPVINVYASENMSVKQLADEIERRIIEQQKRRRMAWQ